MPKTLEPIIRVHLTFFTSKYRILNNIAKQNHMTTSKLIRHIIHTFIENHTSPPSPRLFLRGPYAEHDTLSLRGQNTDHMPNITNCPDVFQWVEMEPGDD